MTFERCSPDSLPPQNEKRVPQRVFTAPDHPARCCHRYVKKALSQPASRFCTPARGLQYEF